MGSLSTIYRALYAEYGEQHWWPAKSPFEVMVGAILTQNTAWESVKRAIDNLRRSRMLTPQAILTADITKLAEQLRPSGYFNIKAERLRNYCDWFLEQGGSKNLNRLDTDSLRRGLLSVNGVGPETADDILLYAFERPVFVVDAYTRRIFSRLGMIEESEGYEQLKVWFEKSLVNEVNGMELVEIFNEYHALIVIHAKEHCRRKPSCDNCPLIDGCKFYCNENLRNDNNRIN